MPHSCSWSCPGHHRHLQEQHCPLPSLCLCFPTCGIRISASDLQNHPLLHPWKLNWYLKSCLRSPMHRCHRRCCISPDSCALWLWGSFLSCSILGRVSAGVWALQPPSPQPAQGLIERMLDKSRSERSGCTGLSFWAQRIKWFLHLWWPWRQDTNEFTTWLSFTMCF